MSVVVLLELAAAKGAADALWTEVSSQLPDTLAFDGCQRVDVLRSRDDADVLVAHEVWESAQHYDRYISWRIETGGAAALTELLRESPSIRTFDSLDV